MFMVSWWFDDCGWICWQVRVMFEKNPSYYLLLYKVKWYVGFSAINKIDNLTGVDYRETH